VRLVELPQGNPVFTGADQIVKRLRDSGHQAWVVGGAVRDLVMGVHPTEFDIATSARPDAVIGLFDRTAPVGIRFGVILVLLHDLEYEVATFRADADYSDGRRPDSVRFTDLREDVLRRDFTMNGLALDTGTGEVTDLVDGIRDIEDGVIRAIGDPFKRFDEDRLRPLRAIRFVAQTGFGVEQNTLAAVRDCASRVVGVSVERIRDEVSKMLGSDRPGAGLRLLEDTGMTTHVLPELLEGAAGAEPVARVLDLLAGNDRETMWAAMFKPLGPSGAGDAMKRFRHSRHGIDAVVGALESSVAIQALPNDDTAVEKRVLRQENTATGLEVLSAWIEATEGDANCINHARKRLSTWSRSDLFPKRLITGEDVIAQGIDKGPDVGAAIKAVEDEQLRSNISTRDDALAFVSRKLTVDS